MIFPMIHRVGDPVILTFWHSDPGPAPEARGVVIDYQRTPFWDQKYVVEVAGGPEAGQYIAGDDRVRAAGRATETSREIGRP